MWVLLGHGGTTSCEPVKHGRCCPQQRCVPLLVMACRAVLHADPEQRRQAAAVGTKQAAGLANRRFWLWCCVTSSSSSPSKTAALAEEWLSWPCTILASIYPHSSKCGARPAAAAGGRYAGAAFSCRLELLLALKPGVTHSPLRRPLATAPAATSGHPERADGGYPFCNTLQQWGDMLAISP